MVSGFAEQMLNSRCTEIIVNKKYNKMVCLHLPWYIIILDREDQPLQPKEYNGGCVYYNESRFCFYTVAIISNIRFNQGY